MGATSVTPRFCEEGLIFQPHVPIGGQREFASIVRLFVMSNMKSGRLTSKNGCIISLTPRDL